MIKDIFVGISCAVVAALATFAYASGGQVSRADIERMIAESEARSNYSIVELKSEQRQIRELLQKMQIDLATMAARDHR